MFKIGDRVVVKGAHVFEGRTGTVVLLPDDKGDTFYIRNGFGIEFDEPHVLSHSCRGKTKKNCGAWVMPEDLKLIKSEKKVKERKLFKIGDKVRVIKDYDAAKEGMKGIIVALLGNNGAGRSHYEKDYYAVDFGKNFGGHTCGGNVPNGNGQWVAPECLELINPKAEKIVITHDGKTTLARLYENNKVVKSSEANCDPKDEFDFTEGAKLAFERLMGEKEEPPFNVGDVVKVKAAGYHFFMDGTLGRVTAVLGEGELEVVGYDPVKNFTKNQRIRIEDCEKVK